MKRTKELILALKEWDEMVSSKTLDLKSLIFFVGYQIGVSEPLENPLVNFEDRINKLVVESEIEESFLIKSLVSEITSTFENHFDNLDSAINSNEFLLEKAKSANKTQVVEMTQATLERLKNPEYIPNSIKQLEVWKDIVSRRFSPEKLKQWDDEDFQMNYEALKGIRK